MYPEKFGTPPDDKLKSKMRLRNDQVYIQAQVDQVQATHEYVNMKSKSKMRILFYELPYHLRLL